MELSTRSESRIHYYGYAGRNTACGAYYANKSNSNICRTESVNSYRGKHQYIQIGRKRRKVFHDFSVYKMLWNSPQTWWYCGSQRGDRIYSTDSFARCNVPLITGLKDSPTYPSATWMTYFGGSQLPLCTEKRLADFGAEMREFVIRDLYIKATSPRFDGAVFLAELDETLVGIHKLLLGSVKSLFKAREMRRNIKNLVLNPEDLWLWWRYMLMPTMMDVENLLQAIKPQEVIDRVQDGDRIEPEKTRGTTYSHKWFSYQDVTIEYPWEQTLKAGFGGAIDIYSRSDPHEWGTSSWDVLRATLERIPFSFVADWFLNLSDWLSSLRSLEIVYAQSYATYAVDVEIKFPTGTDVGQAGMPISHYYLMNRVTNVEPPSLPLVDKRWRNCLRTIDLISLTIGMLKGILKRRR